MHTICFLLWHSLMARHSQRNWNESSGCLRAYVCVCVLSKCLLCVSFQPNPRKIIKCMKAKTIRIFMLIYAFNEMIQHNWKKKRIKIYVHTAQEWLISLNLMSSRHIFLHRLTLHNDFIHNSFLFMDFCNHFHTPLQLNGTGADIAAIPCPFTVYHKKNFMCSNIKWTTINN